MFVVLCFGCAFWLVRVVVNCYFGGLLGWLCFGFGGFLVACFSCLLYSEVLGCDLICVGVCLVLTARWVCGG